MLNSIPQKKILMIGLIMCLFNYVISEQEVKDYTRLSKYELNRKLYDVMDEYWLDISEERLQEAVILINTGADINFKSRRGYTALMRAAYHGHTEIVRLLMGKGADINLKGKHGDIALTLAIRFGHEEIVKLLKDKSGYIA